MWLPIRSRVTAPLPHQGEGEPEQLPQPIPPDGTGSKRRLIEWQHEWITSLPLFYSPAPAY